MVGAAGRAIRADQVHVLPSPDSIGGAPPLRVRAANDAPVADGPWVLYWMIAARRLRGNFALDRAAAWARALGRPLVILEALRVDYPWASDRLHRFVLDGMADQRAMSEGAPVLYYPYVEPSAGAGKGLLEALAGRACAVVTDEYPGFFLPRMVQAAARRLRVRLEVVDGNGLLPLAAADRDFTAAAHFRRHLQRALPAHLGAAPRADGLAGLDLPRLAELPRAIRRAWPAADRRLLDGDAEALSRLPIDHAVPVVATRGGSRAAHAALRRFVTRRLDEYDRLRDEPSADATSRLSPYLHFGHIGVHEIFAAVARHERWSPARLGRPDGARFGFWGMRAPAELFLDQLVTWRGLAYHTAARQPQALADFASLPGWAQRSLRKHARDPRPHRYDRAQLERAQTHDEVWNAAQRQLLAEGWFHNYLRMLWGKKILEWSRRPEDALATMAAIMDRWSLDGRDPNSYAGYAWALGRYDRPWPERPVFGTVRSMSSASTRRKLRLKEFLAKYGDSAVSAAPSAAPSRATRR